MKIVKGFFTDSKENYQLNIINVMKHWHLTAFRFGWFGLPPEDRWVDYLGGFAFTFEKNRVLLSDNGELKAAAVPHWWKNY